MVGSFALLLCNDQFRALQQRQVLKLPLKELNLCNVKNYRFARFRAGWLKHVSNQ
jgi:hypothetical protein